MIDSKLYLSIVFGIDSIHASDIAKETFNNHEYPSELLYSKRMMQILELISPSASNQIRIAAQCQHIKRWNVERSLFPMDRKGYHQWRQAVMSYQLEQTKEILLKHKVHEGDIDEIIETLSNQGNKSYPNSQLIEDTACLVFLKWYLEPFAQKHETDKVIDILRKTHRKISETGLEAISKLELSDNVKLLLQQAIG